MIERKATDRLPTERPMLERSATTEAARTGMAAFHPDIVAIVKAAVEKHPVVVVGMAQNPFVKEVRKVLDAAGKRYVYIGYGSYLSKWKERLAIKLWTGWATFPQVFINGVLIGGCDETKKALADGTFVQMLETHPNAA